MFTKKAFWMAVILAGAILGAANRTTAQESASAPKAVMQPETGGAKSPSQSAALEQYHLDFSLNELEDGKRINSRQYSMNLDTYEGNEIKIGTRVPVETKEGEFEYLDVGTNIFARIGETRGQQQLVVRADISNFAIPEQDQEKLQPHPVIREIKMGGSVLLPLNKTFVMSSADDPNSKRQFQLEVTVSKLR
jgi:hypothetical protein